MLESLINLVIPTLVIIGAVLMAIGFVLWKYVGERIISIMGLILLIIGFILLIVGIIQLL